MISDLQRQLGIDSTFFPQFFLFLGIFLFLRLVYFGPFLRLILAREGQSGGRSDEAARLQEEAARLEQDYQEKISAARKRAGAERDQLLVAARKDGNEIIARAREEAKTKLEQSRTQSEKEAGGELATLRGQVDAVAGQLVQKLTHTKVGL